MSGLTQEAEALIDRLKGEGTTLELDQTQDGKYIVLFMAFKCPPPPKGDTKEDAINKFAEWYESTYKSYLRANSIEEIHNDEGRNTNQQTNAD